MSFGLRRSPMARGVPDARGAHFEQPSMPMVPPPGLSLTRAETSTASRERRRVHLAAREIGNVVNEEISQLREQVCQMQVLLRQVAAAVSCIAPLVVAPDAQLLNCDERVSSHCLANAASDCTTPSGGCGSFVLSPAKEWSALSGDEPLASPKVCLPLAALLDGQCLVSLLTSRPVDVKTPYVILWQTTNLNSMKRVCSP